MADSEEKKGDFQEVVQVYTKAKRIVLFLRKYWWAHTVLIAFATGGFEQYKELKNTEHEFKLAQDSLRQSYKTINFLSIEMRSAYQRLTTDKIRLDNDSVLINDCYWYKTPFSAWGEGKK